MFFKVDGFNSGDANTLVTNYYQAGPGNIRDTLAIVKNHLFRTKAPLLITVSVQKFEGCFWFVPIILTSELLCPSFGPHICM